MANEFRPSKRAERVWTRLTEWYGKRFSDQYGTDCTRDWAHAIDDADNDAVKLALSECRNKHTSFPPTLPEFEQLLHRSSRPPPATGPSATDRLTEYVLANKPLTSAQLRMPWKFIGELYDAPDLAGKMSIKHGGRIAGVIVPSDGSAPGYRVMLQDTVMQQFPESRGQQADHRMPISELVGGDWGSMDANRDFT